METPIYDQLLTQQQQADEDATRTEAQADKAEGLPWLRFFRG